MTRARVLWTGEARPPLWVEGGVYAVAILGELRFNLSRAALAGRPTLVVLTLGGRVVVEIPREWSVIALPPQPTLLRIQELTRQETQIGVALSAARLAPARRLLLATA